MRLVLEGRILSSVTGATGTVKILDELYNTWALDHASFMHGGESILYDGVAKLGSNQFIICKDFIVVRHVKWMPMIVWFVPMKSRNYFYHGELFLVTFCEVHSRNLVWCLFGNSCSGINSEFSCLQLLKVIILSMSQ
ncbi:hypothetical protein ALC57_03900 [Trachymyrmex cornetzi]|uniref:Uncharacterized protein n=1 Tax=Trachymyrmex cornetzi TaxID=471704 RepID=A0A151JMG5_9HYME|nr:hypothetical protein ALC57_03900 [Trachymyrmex cornetzi]